MESKKLFFCILRKRVARHEANSSKLIQIVYEKRCKMITVQHNILQNQNSGNFEYSYVSGKKMK